MKKIGMFVLALALSAGVFANDYRLDESNVETMIENAEDVTMTELADYESLSSTSFAASAVAGSQTRGGFLLRSFFCGGFALHRYYMGSEGAKYFFLYFCVPVVGGVTNCVDFWSVVFNADNLSRYNNADKYIVWLD